MNVLTISNLSKQYSERLLFDGANLVINEGDRIGLIGVNGSGKSTLLRLAAGLETPDGGSVTSWGHVRVEYLAQEPRLDDALTVLQTIFYSESEQMQLLRDYEETSHALQLDPDNDALQTRLVILSAELDRTAGWAAEANAKTILTQLGITDFAAKVGTLSGGQRKRVALARALIDRADLLILDEPTNHIDAETVAWLESYLATTPGALLMVTHDRYFLDHVVNRIVELDRRQLVSYVGNYTKYLEDHEARHERLANAEAKRQQMIRRELEWLRRGAMARSTKQKARVQRAEELMKIRYDSGEDRVSITLAGRRLGNSVLEAKGLTKRYQDKVILDQVDFALEPGDRIGLLGPNGAGKSTLLDILAGKLAADAGSVTWGDTVQVAYYDQRSADLQDQMRLIEFIEKEAPLIRTKDGERVEAAHMLEWFLFPRAMQYGRIGNLSGGERRRLYLLRTLIHQPNVLILDEPTNDLDIQTLGVLEEFIDYFQGCLVVVSHDRYFLDRTVDYLIPVENGKLGGRYPTPYATYLRLRAEEEQAAQPAVASVKTAAPPTPKPPPTSRKLSWKEQRELATLEQAIAQLETNKATLTAAINAGSSDYQRLQAMGDELADLDTQLETILERWYILAELADA
ncbi:MAG: ABC-F family ATP-binding cassette domain-containing protein [Caldilineaceae bacterium]|nr:ABC-F family ATP-binding cassette domain-containing protein [Caldilineaceae bacterium]